MPIWNNVISKEQINKTFFLLTIFIVNLDGFFNLHHADTIILGIFLLVVLANRAWRLVYCALLFFLLRISRVLFIWLNFQLYAIQLLLVFVLSTAIIVPFKSTRTALSWIKGGRLDRMSCILLYLTGILSTGALIIWASLTDHLGAGQQMAEGIAYFPQWLIFLAIIPLFALINALAEEVIYRGVLQEALMKVFSVAVAVLLQASAFAAIHFASGFPNGYTGYVMVFVYGLMLGYLRVRTGGMLAPYLTHVIADLVIGYYLCFSAIVQ